MKRIVYLLTILIMALASCTKEKLEVIDVPGEFNDNSLTYQEYLAERAISFIKIYRFDKMREVLPQINDPVVKEEINKVYSQYKKKADREALYFITPEKDTLFFLVPSETEPDPATRTKLYIQHDRTNIPKTHGILSGLKKFPKLKSLRTWAALASGVKELEHLPDLEDFYWDRNKDFYLQYFPNEVYTGEKLVVDFSKNTKIKTITLQDVDIENIVFPETKIELLHLKGILSAFNSNSVLNTLKAQKAILEGISINSDLVLDNPDIDEIQIEGSLKKVDISKTNLQTIKLSYVEQVKWNDNIKKIIIHGGKLSGPIQFPDNMESLELRNYAFDNWDFSYLSKLTEFTAWFSGIAFTVESSNLKLPLSLEKLNLSIEQEDRSLDISYLTNLKEFISATQKYNDLKLPAHLELLDIFRPSGILDLSHLTNLKRINLTADETLTEIKFPDNMPKDMMTDGYSSMYLSPSTTLTNAPDWIADFIRRF